MGGNALSFQTTRLNKVDYHQLKERVALKLCDKVIDCAAPPSFHNKESFGDLDIIIKKDIGVDYSRLIAEVFNPREIRQNSNVFSFDYQNFQVDFVIHEPEIFNSAIHYYSYSPSGNLIGKLCHQFGLRYGHDGLFYTYQKENCSNHKILLTRNVQEVHQFLGLCHDTFVKGFGTRENIFDWICKSKYFNPQIFSYEAMNHVARTRDRKRSDYRQFLEWLEVNKGNYYCYKSDGDKEKNLRFLLGYFPNLKYDIIEHEKFLLKQKEIRAKFNGKLVMEWFPNLSGSELGKVIQGFKSTHGQNIEEWTAAEVKEKFEEWVLNYGESCNKPAPLNENF